MTVHPNSPTANHEHNSLLTDERSSNIIIFLSNYWFVLCFFPKTKARAFAFFSFKGIKVAFSGKRTEVTKRHLETLNSAIWKVTSESGKHSEYDQIYIFRHFSKLFKWSKTKRATTTPKHCSSNLMFSSQINNGRTKEKTHTSKQVFGY